MLAGDDAAAGERAGVEVADVGGRAVIDAKLKHLVEIAVVERPVPADREVRPAHDDVGRLRVERVHEQVHVPLQAAGPLDVLEEAADRHVRDREQPVEHDPVPHLQLAPVVALERGLVAGEEGISDAGLSLSRILPAPKNIFLEGTAQIFRGDTGGLFQAAKRSDVSVVGHLRGYRDISESTNIDLGGSFARGRSPFGDGWNQLYGLDATLRWKPLRRAIYHSFVGRGELIWARTLFRPAQTGTPAPMLTINPPSSGSHVLGFLNPYAATIRLGGSDVKHRLTGVFLWELPLGKGKWIDLHEVKRGAIDAADCQYVPADHFARRG